tara:strand:+ start:261 stop:1310 length:1050 start_codon:yes stop_codon:yes gene_type:complete
MNFKRLCAIFIARNREFFRDRAAFGWNFLFPFLIIGGFGVIFSGKGYTEYKIGVFPYPLEIVSVQNLKIPEQFQKNSYVEFIGFKTLEDGLEKLKHHKIDFLMKIGSPSHQYWLSDSSPKGYIIEKVFMASLQPVDRQPIAEKKEIQGKEIEYIDWLFPGILAMNMMFSALWGVGYIVVRYRKNGVLKRLRATPLTAFEYLGAQLFSRIFLLMFSLVVVWVGCDLFFSFHVEGSYFNLFLVFFVGGLSLSSLGLLVASRGTSEEFTGGILNFITWPMMFLSEVWFSIEGSPQWIKMIARVFPLTHMLTGVRKIMNDGAGLSDVGLELSIMLLITLICLGLGARLFSWNK